MPRTTNPTVIERLAALRGSAAEKGYVLALTALLILPLVGAVALSVDLGAWYARASQVQRISDAASLAGVVYLPDTEKAAQVAMDTIRANGIPLEPTGPQFSRTTADGDISVTITPILAGTSQLKVEIIEDNAAQYFSGVFTDEVSVGRQSTAEFIKPIAMGSPKNYLGTGDLAAGRPAETECGWVRRGGSWVYECYETEPAIPGWGSGTNENYWLAISGVCASREQGERIMSVSDGNYTTTRNPPSGGNSFASCDPDDPSYSYVEENPEYSEDGYYYALEIPPAFTGSVSLEIFDAPYCGGNSGAGDQTGGFDTIYRVLDNDAIDPRNATELVEDEVNDSSGDWRCDDWWTIYSWNNPDPGIYYLNVAAEVPDDLEDAAGEGTNQFALRANYSGLFEECDSRAQAETCPRVYGTQHMGVFAEFDSSTPSFFLADIGPEHSGKVLEITLWDMGEGTQRLRILNPLQQRATFKWTALCLDGDEPTAGSCPGEMNPTGGRSGVSSNLYTGGSGTQPGAHRVSSSLYNDRLMLLEIQLPDDIADAYDGNTWWRVQYETGSTPTDRTTWSVIVRGDPVRLVP